MRQPAAAKGGGIMKRTFETNDFLLDWRIYAAAIVAAAIGCAAFCTLGRVIGVMP